MEVTTVKKQIMDKSLDKFYIFSGLEVKAQEIYLYKMAEVSNKTLQWIDSISDIYTKSKSLFSKPKLYVCRDDKDFMKSEKAWGTIEQALGDNMLVFLWTEVDKRTKFYKNYQDRIVQFNYMSSAILEKHITKEVDLNEHWCAVLIQVCESDYSRILLEIDKIKNYMSANGQITANMALNDLLQSGAIHIPPQDAIFDFVDAILKRQSQKAFELLDECKKIGEPALRLITVLYTNARKVLLVQSCKSNDISKTTGLSSWDIKCVSDKVGCWDTGDLVYMLRLFRQVERNIKIGEIDEDVAMDYIMTNVF